MRHTLARFASAFIFKVCRRGSDLCVFKLQLDWFILNILSWKIINLLGVLKLALFVLYYYQVKPPNP